MVFIVLTEKRIDMKKYIKTALLFICAYGMSVGQEANAQYKTDFLLTGISEGPLKTKIGRAHE